METARESCAGNFFNCRLTPGSTYKSHFCCEFISSERLTLFKVLLRSAKTFELSFSGDKFFYEPEFFIHDKILVLIAGYHDEALLFHLFYQCRS